jgi:type VI secretion system secreted protein Hcp
VSLAFSKFSHGHIEQKADGSAGPATEAGWDFTANKAFSKSPGASAELDKLVSQVGADANVDYYVSFGDAGGGKWLELESFSLGFDQSGTLSGGGAGGAGRATAQDVMLVLGSSKSVVQLTDALASGEHVKGVSIEAYTHGEKSMLLDRFDFDNVTITGLQTTGNDSGTANALSFAFDKFEQSHQEQKADGSAGSKVEAGWDFKLSKEASANGAPGSGGSEAKLGEQLPTDAHLEYYVRFDGVQSSGAQWLRLDDFSMGLSMPVSGAAGGSRTTGKLSADEVSLLLGSSSAIVQLSDDLFSGAHLKNFEVEAYRVGGDSKAQLVDEFWFENVLVKGLDHTGATANEVSLAFSKFSHGHIEQKADGSAGPATEAGWDFTKNVEWTHGAPHADIDFLL